MTGNCEKIRGYLFWISELYFLCSKTDVPNENRMTGNCETITPDIYLGFPNCASTGKQKHRMTAHM